MKDMILNKFSHLNIKYKNYTVYMLKLQVTNQEEEKILIEIYTDGNRQKGRLLNRCIGCICEINLKSLYNENQIKVKIEDGIYEYDLFKREYCAENKSILKLSEKGEDYFGFRMIRHSYF